MVNFILEQRATPFLETYKAGRYHTLTQLSQQLEPLVEDDALILVNQPGRELHYLTRRRVAQGLDLQAMDATLLIGVLDRRLATQPSVYVVASPSAVAQHTHPRVQLLLGEPLLRVPATPGAGPPQGQDTLALYRVRDRRSDPRPTPNTAPRE